MFTYYYATINCNRSNEGSESNENLQEENTRDIEIKIQDLKLRDDMSFIIQMEDLSDRRA